MTTAGRRLVDDLAQWFDGDIPWNMIYEGVAAIESEAAAAERAVVLALLDVYEVARAAVNADTVASMFDAMIALRAALARYEEAAK